MGDVAQILAPATPAPGPPIGGAKPGASAVEIAGMSREVMDLLKGKHQDPSSAGLPPIVPTLVPSAGADARVPKPGAPSGGSESESKSETRVKVGSKWISASKRARPWTWAPFASSSRTDGAVFHHWVRKNVEYTDYPYAKFDVHMDPVAYTPEEYSSHLESETWTRSETDRLMELVRTFECRWPVILDRFGAEYSISTTTTNNNNNNPANGRTIEDLQHRYYGVAAVLSQVRIAKQAAIEAMNLSAEATKSAAASAPTKAGTVAGGPAAPPAPASNPAAAGGTPSNAAVRPAAHPQETTNRLLLESAAARALATSAGHHQPLIAHVGTGTTNKVFDYARERQRRRHLDRLWRRSKEDEEEETLLRKELRAIDAQLRKLKKHGGHVLAAKATGARGDKRQQVASSSTGAGRTGTAQVGAAVSSSRGPSRSATPVPRSTGATGAVAVELAAASAIQPEGSDLLESLDSCFFSTAPVPMQGHPYLQSGRLAPPSAGGPSGINKSLLSKMDKVLRELNIPERPLPTKRVCDLYDSVRKDVLSLITLQKMLLQREGQLQSKRLRLSRMGGASVAPEDKVLDEEGLFGIAPPSKPAGSGNGTPGSAAKAKAVKRKPSAGSGKAKAAGKKGAGTDSGSKSASAGAATGSTPATKKKTVKRKRKSGESSGSTKGSTPRQVPGPAPARTATKARATPAAKPAAPAPARPPVPAPDQATMAAAIAAAAAEAVAGTTPVVLPKTTATTKAPPASEGAAAGGSGSAAKRPRKS
ncbi:unnamed protein product [Pseudo-nitzschia multistriata]|uniref:dAMP1 SANT/Myb-like domain-containing protein n=1 Tax=Pseudo-nitzschia multistriata TaxID=183589 RepID=A0A448Z671_9STRA|nr:unnamed protein product [Pseudo-nitzschia multistriata]